MDILSIEDMEERRQRINTMIDNVVLALENYIDLDEFQSLLHGLPAVSAEAIKQFIAQVIDFYKSYKVDFLGLNTLYYLDDKYDGVIRLIDDLALFRNFTKNEMIYVTELIHKLQVSVNYEEKLQLLETIFLDIETWAKKHYHEYILIRDEIPTKIVRLMMYSVAMIGETYEISTRFTPMDFATLNEFINSIGVNLGYDENISIKDRAWVIPVFEAWIKELSSSDTMEITDELSITATYDDGTTDSGNTGTDTGDTGTTTDQTDGA